MTRHGHAATAAWLFLMLGTSCRSGTTGHPAPAAAEARTPTASPAVDTTQAINDRFVQAILARIAGREGDSAKAVFRNVQMLTAVPARTFLSIMNGGYARALGVTCTHCHVETDFSSDEKRPKRAAREMAVMHRMINQELRKMENLATPATQNRAINCITCHRGTVNPMATPR